MIILGQCKRPEEREFYLRMAVQERWSSRQLDRQLKVALFEPAVVTPAKVSAVTWQIQPESPLYI
jgi:predicted nuclease of restriction endonuclease-like (RecB) superfamily